jgi:hypothetical protein
MLRKYVRLRDQYLKWKATQMTNLPVEWDADIHQTYDKMDKPTVTLHSTVPIEELVKFDMSPRRPELDTTGTGKYEIYHTEIPSFPTKRSLANNEVLHYKAATVHNPEGKCIGMLSLSRIQHLYYGYQTSNVVAKLPFEEEVGKLLNRYKDGHINNKGQKTKMHNHWTTPPLLMTFIQNKFQLQGEKFASPLNVHPHSKAYWSMYEEDAVFGAQHDAYSHRWTGGYEANPEYEDEEMDKAVGWAVNSALASQEPTLTIFILPAWDDHSNTSYMRWCKTHPNTCYLLSKLSKRYFKFMTPDHWSGEDNFAGTTKWHINIMAVMNENGRQIAIREGCFNNLEEELRAALIEQFGESEVRKGFVKTYTYDILNHHNETDNLSNRCYRKWNSKPRQSYNYKTTGTSTTTYVVLNSPQPALDWEEIAYTDGSLNPNKDPKKEARLGAAV